VSHNEISFVYDFSNMRIFFFFTSESKLSEMEPLKYKLADRTSPIEMFGTFNRIFATNPFNYNGATCYSLREFPLLVEGKSN
jgi:hypothetical protein